jgi:hypothetical protein
MRKDIQKIQKFITDLKPSNSIEKLENMRNSLPVDQLPVLSGQKSKPSGINLDNINENSSSDGE